MTEMTEQEITDRAAELAKDDTTAARTESTRAVDAAGKLITALGVLGGLGATLGGLAVKGHAYVGGALLLLAAAGMFVAFDRAVSVIQARIPVPLPTSPGWLGLLGEPRERFTEHYRARAADPIGTYAAQVDVLGEGAYHKHRRNRATALLIRGSLLIGGAGGILSALGI